MPKILIKKITLLLLFLMALTVNIFLYMHFQNEGQCFFYNIYPLYALLFLMVIVLLKNFKILKINLLLLLSILFLLEHYFIFFNKGIQTYEEQLGSRHYTSLYAMGYKYGYDNFNNWISRPNSEELQTNSDFSYLKKYNSLGFRDVEPDSANKNNDIIIAALGDSFTEGNGTPQDSTWPALLENKLNKINERKSKVINAGVAGSDPVYEYMLYKTKVAQFKPSFLILSVNISDIIDLMCKKGFDRYQLDKIVYNEKPYWEYFYAISRVFRNLACTFFKIDPYLLLTPAKKEIRYKKAYTDFKECIEKFTTLTKKTNCQFLLVYNPHLFEFSNMQSTMHLDFSFEKDLKLEIKNKTLNTPIVFLKDSLIKYKLMDTSKLMNFYWPHDYHFKPIGYNAWAEFMKMEISHQLK